jgi:hypothetical protein
MIDKSFFILELLVKQADNMEMAMWLDYKPMRYEGKGFLICSSVGMRHPLQITLISEIKGKPSR